MFMVLFSILCESGPRRSNSSQRCRMLQVNVLKALKHLSVLLPLLLDFPFHYSLFKSVNTAKAVACADQTPENHQTVELC